MKSIAACGSVQALEDTVMRTIGILLLMTFILGLTGCIKAIDQYYTVPKHYRFGTAKVKQVDRTVESAYNAALNVLVQNGWGVAKKELETDSASIRATRQHLEMVIDIKGEGESSEVRVELDQSGNDGEVWAFFSELEMMP
ncbi:hypothetical protein K2Y11_07875 [bacterium]|nr:hypothetical protein [bacterium]